MKLKELLELVSSDTKINVIFDYDYDMGMYDPVVLDPSDYPRHENLQVEDLSIDKNLGILNVYINAIGYYYNAETDKYEKRPLNWVKE